MLPEATQEVVNRSYRRLLPRLEARFKGRAKGTGRKLGGLSLPP